MSDLASSERGLVALSNLTENQLLFWIGQKIQRDIPLETHAIRFVLTIEGSIEPDHIERAVRALVNQADSLRTVVREVGLVPMRRVAEQLDFSIDQVRCSSEPDPDAAFRAWMDVKRHTPLKSEAPFEAALIELGPKRVALYLGFNHLISDARSVYLAVQHVSRCYQLSLEGKLETAPPLPPFEDYVAYDRAHQSSEGYRAAAAHWRKKLTESPRLRPTVTALGGTKRSAWALDKLRTERHLRELPREETIALQALVRREVLISPAIPFLSTLLLTMARIRGSVGSLTIGTPFLNRTDQFLDTIGLFVSTCPLVVRVDERDTFLTVTRKVQTEFVRASRHQNYPVQNPAHGRLFEAFFNYLNIHFRTFAGQRVQVERIRSGYSNNTFSLAAYDLADSGRFTLDFEFQHQEFSADRQQEAVSSFLTLLDAFLSDPGASIAPFL